MWRIVAGSRMTAGTRSRLTIMKYLVDVLKLILKETIIGLAINRLN